MLPFLIPLLTSLASNGISTLAGAIQAKGVQVIEEKLGIKLPTSEAQLTPEMITLLKQKEMEHEEFLLDIETKKAEIDLAKEQIRLDAETTASIQVTDRWTADMGSDSRLAKNIRPLTLLFILFIYTLFALLSAADVQVTESYVTLLGEWGMLIMSAYFAGRSIEKVTSIMKGGN